MAGRASSHDRTPAVPVVSAEMGAVAGPRAIRDSRVSVPWGSVGPIAQGGNEGGVRLSQALPDVRELVSQVAEVHPALTVGHTRPEWARKRWRVKRFASSAG